MIPCNAQFLLSRGTEVVQIHAQIFQSYPGSRFVNCHQLDVGGKPYVGLKVVPLIPLGSGMEL